MTPAALMRAPRDGRVLAYGGGMTQMDRLRAPRGLEASQPRPPTGRCAPAADFPRRTNVIPRARVEAGATPRGRGGGPRHRVAPDFADRGSGERVVVVERPGHRAAPGPTVGRGHAAVAVDGHGLGFGG